MKTNANLASLFATTLVCSWSPYAWGNPTCESLSQSAHKLETFDVTRLPLSRVDQNLKPWTHFDGEQPFTYVGSTPYEMAQGHSPRSIPLIFESLKDLAERELPRVRKLLSLESAEFEIWPSFDGWRNQSWTVARYRESSRHVWKWLDQSFKNPNQTASPTSPLSVVFPDIYDPKVPQNFARIFDHRPAEIALRPGFSGRVTAWGNLYSRPEFQSTVWISKDHRTVHGAWKTYDREPFFKALLEREDLLAVTLPPPARFNEEPITFIVRSSGDTVTFEQPIEWRKDMRLSPRPVPVDSLIVTLPNHVSTLYKSYLQMFSGEKPIISPRTSKKIDFAKQSSADPNNELLDTLAYLRRLHEEMGYVASTPGSANKFEIEEQHFTWENVPQANLMVRVRGNPANPYRRTVTGTSHYDKAVAEDIYEQSNGQRLDTTPGADDNITGVAAMLIAAEALIKRYASLYPENDIELVYFTGEEFPSDCAGARHYVSHALKTGKKLHANLNLDMLGNRTKDTRVYQINPGLTEGSWELAELALGIAHKVGGGWEPVVRYPWSKKSYLVQTDGAIFDWAGIRTVFINEHINLGRRLNEVYHQSTDRAQMIDLPYALAQTQVFIELLVRLAESK